ncbi:MAG TPA: 50S ribosome-binding GTPase [Anaerolineae bacterium]|nr:50S ribosome-binding GTPase [Anaerolineae bacterium]HPL26439.1 50S ribosome-binding GTPase [Anaerolineae bacterium]
MAKSDHTDERDALREALAGDGGLQMGRVLDQLGLAELKRLLPLVRRQYAPLFAARKTVCLVGPVNTGKSSLYNALVGPTAPRAEVSPVPGTTRRALRGDAEAFWVVDTPGANEAAVGKEGQEGAAARHSQAIEAAARADFLVIVFDAARGIAQDEAYIYGELTGLGKPFVVALNKIDLVGKDEEAVLRAVAATLHLEPERIIRTSATRRINLNRLLLAILETDPEILATLAEMAPGARWALATSTILGACAAAGTANLVTAPIAIPFSSFVPISAIQVAMVLKLARVFGLKLSLARAKEIALTFGSGLLARTLFYQLVDLVPVAGYVLGTAIAAGTTMALGYSVAAWFAYGERPSSDAVKALSRRLTQLLLERLKRYPDRKALRDGIELAVQETLHSIDNGGEGAQGS